MWYLQRILAQLKLIGGHFLAIGRLIWSYAMTHRLIAGAAVLLVCAGVGALIYFTGGAAAEPLDERKEVALIRVGDVSLLEPLSLVGEIRAAREALIAPDSSGAIAGVYRSLGDYVGAGTVIAELKNDRERATVAQASAALEKAKSGEAVGAIGIENAQNSFKAALESARTVAETAYATINDAVKKKADQSFSNPDSSQPHLTVSSSNSQLVSDAENMRVQVQPILARHAAMGELPATDTAVLSELERLATEAAVVRDFISALVSTLNNAIAGGVSESAIATYRTEANTALSNINALRGTLTATIESVKAKRAAVAIAEENIAKGATGETADVRAAEANLASARANLERTLIRAPISGNINRLDLEVGSFVSAGSPVVYITNEGGLEAVVFVSDRDIKDIAVGAKALVGGVAEATVSRVAKALDPLTKKAEVRVAIPAGSQFFAGQSASIAISRTRLVQAGQTGPLSIPLSALKITPEGPVVFTVSAEGILFSHPIVLGTLRGNTTEVKEGLTPDMEIVLDARGIKAGQEVTVKESI